MKMYKIVIDTAPRGDFIVLADSYEEALDFIRPFYVENFDFEDYRVQFAERELERGVAFNNS